MKIIEIHGRTAIVEADTYKHMVNLALLKDVKIGDYILAHGNIAINKISEEDAENIFKMLKSFEETN